MAPRGHPKAATLRRLKLHYELDARNIDVRHRWCEIIMKRRLSSQYETVRNFVVRDHGCGIYLFGELLFAGTRGQAVAAAAYKELVALGGVEENVRQTLLEMFREAGVNAEQ